MDAYKRARGYREQAQYFRGKAADCREYDLQEQMLWIAKDYERLAQWLEQGLGAASNGTNPTNRP